MKDALLLGFGLIAVVGFVFSDSGDDAAPAAGTERALAAKPAGDKAAKADSYARWSAGETVLPRSSDGHFYADATVNGRGVDFLVDTGASVVALTGTDARAVGLDWNDGDIREIARGANGPVYGISVTIDTLQLGGHEARNVRAIVVPEGLEISLLGQNFLSTVNPVRIEENRMVLGG